MTNGNRQSNRANDTHPMFTFHTVIRTPNEVFEADTKAVSAKKAKANSIFKWALYKKMSIAQAQKAITTMGTAVSITVTQPKPH